MYSGKHQIYGTNGATTDDQNVITKRFNVFFVNVGTVLAKSMPPTYENSVDYMRQDVIDTLYFYPAA